MNAGLAPTACNVVCVDFDATLYPWEPIWQSPPPLAGAAEAVRRLKAAGYRIVILTSRLSPTWLGASGISAEEMRSHVVSMLYRDGIPYDELTSEKVPAEVYIDDRAIRFREGEWPAIVDWVLFARGAE